MFGSLYKFVYNAFYDLYTLGRTQSIKIIKKEGSWKRRLGQMSTHLVKMNDRTAHKGWGVACMHNLPSIESRTHLGTIPRLEMTFPRGPRGQKPEWHEEENKDSLGV